MANNYQFSEAEKADIRRVMGYPLAIYRRTSTGPLGIHTPRPYVVRRMVGTGPV